MKTILFSVLFLLFTTRVRSKTEPNTDYFVMAEAHITEYRHREDANAAHLPFYVECSLPATRFSCRPAIPKMDSREGYVTYRRSTDSTGKNVYYGCPQNIQSKDVFNPDQHYQKALMLRRAHSTLDSTSTPLYYNIYKYRCESEVRPVLWVIENFLGTKVLYGIGFYIDGLEKTPLATVYYDYERGIPIWTKHTLYGKSLAAPTAAFKSIEEIVYQTNLEKITNADLRANVESYYQFNLPTNERRKEFNEIWQFYEMSQLPDQTYIVMGHLIPEYDMIMSNWQKISQFSQTVVPTWEELYLNEWADVEEMIRDFAFAKERQLTVYSGTDGQLELNIPTKEYAENTKFYIGQNPVVFPELIWKIVVDDQSSDIRKATMVVFPNLTKTLIDLKIFSKIQPPCNTICNKFRLQSNVRAKSEVQKLIYCCNVDDVKHGMEKLPEDLMDRVHEVLFE